MTNFFDDARAEAEKWAFFSDERAHMAGTIEILLKAVDELAADRDEIKAVVGGYLDAAIACSMRAQYSEETLDAIRALHHEIEYVTSSSSVPGRKPTMRTGCSCVLGATRQSCPTLTALTKHTFDTRLDAVREILGDEPLIVSGIRRDMKDSPHRRGGMIKHTPGTVGRGAGGCPGDNLLNWIEDLRKAAGVL